MQVEKVDGVSLGRILLVEDDQSLSDWIKDYLVSKCFEVEQCFSGETAVEQILSTLPDIVILDGMLPVVDGLDVCKQVRSQFSGRIIMLTARDEDIDEVLALEIGADDYLTKPVRARVLLARISTQMRQLKNVDIDQTLILSNKEIQLGKLIVNKSSRSVQLFEDKIDLTSTELDVLWLLAEQAGEIVSRNDLIKHLRGFDYDGFDRSIDLKVSRLRKKLGDNSKLPTKIITVWGKGYLLVKDAWQ